MGQNADAAVGELDILQGEVGRYILHQQVTVTRDLHNQGIDLCMQSRLVHAYLTAYLTEGCNGCLISDKAPIGMGDGPFHGQGQVSGVLCQDIMQLSANTAGPGCHGGDENVIRECLSKGGHIQDRQCLGQGLDGNGAIRGLDIGQGNILRQDNRITLAGQKTHIEQQDISALTHCSYILGHHILDGDVPVGIDHQCRGMDEATRCRRCILFPFLRCDTAGLHHGPGWRLHADAGRHDFGIHQGDIPCVHSGLKYNLGVVTYGGKRAAKGWTFIVLIQFIPWITGHFLVNRDTALTRCALTGGDLDDAVLGLHSIGDQNIRACGYLDVMTGLDLAVHLHTPLSGCNGDIGFTRHRCVFACGLQKSGLTDHYILLSANLYGLGGGQVDHVINHGILRHHAAHCDIPFSRFNGYAALITRGIHTCLNQDIVVCSDRYISGCSEGIQAERGKVQRTVRCNHAAAPIQALLNHRDILPVGDLLHLDYRDLALDGLIARPPVHDIVGIGKDPVGDIGPDILDRLPVGGHLDQEVLPGLAGDIGITPIGVQFIHGLQTVRLVQIVP